MLAMYVLHKQTFQLRIATSSKCKYFWTPNLSTTFPISILSVWFMKFQSLQRKNNESIQFGKESLSDSAEQLK